MIGDQGKYLVMDELEMEYVIHDKKQLQDQIAVDNHQVILKEHISWQILVWVMERQIVM